MNPSHPQLRMLHILSRGKLVFRNWPYPEFDLPTDYTFNESWRFRLSTAKVIVERGWAELKGFNTSRGEYRITNVGRQLVQALCECWEKRDAGTRGRGDGAKRKFKEASWRVRNEEQDTEQLADKMLCKHCVRLVPCVSKKTAAHAADRWHWKWGPMCSAHWEMMFGVTRKGQRISRQREADATAEVKKHA